MSVSPNAKVSGELSPSITLSGRLVAAFLLAANAWDDRRLKIPQSDGISEKNVVIREQMLGNRLAYAVGFSPRVYGPGTLACDFQWRIDIATWKIGPMSRIC